MPKNKNKKKKEEEGKEGEATGGRHCKTMMKAK